ncbi:MAG: 4'-phosphopantetheinyl transferase superfamily protein [Flavobacteriaceae bacterium]|nr:4'-phosphopantetheinyl transferase superfamily protein [Flavobacteriaceae bacterium]
MPLHKIITKPDDTTVLIWQITEPEIALRSGIKMRENSLRRLSFMSSEIHRKGFLSIRHLLKKAGYTDKDLEYNASGKPELADDLFISISHSFDYSAIALSKRKIGIDVERIRDKVKNIAPKFIKYEQVDYNSEQAAQQLTKIWCVKESIYKIEDIAGLSFRKNIYVKPNGSAVCIANSQWFTYQTEYVDLEHYQLAFVLKN